MTGPHVTVDQVVTVPLNGGSLVFRRLREQLRHGAVAVLRGHAGHRRRFGERRRAFGRHAVFLHRHRDVRVLLGCDVVRAAGQLGLLPSEPHVQRQIRQRSAGQERQQAR